MKEYKGFKAGDRVEALGEIWCDNTSTIIAKKGEIGTVEKVVVHPAQKYIEVRFDGQIEVSWSTTPDFHFKKLTVTSLEGCFDLPSEDRPAGEYKMTDEGFLTSEENWKPGKWLI